MNHDRAFLFQVEIIQGTTTLRESRMVLASSLAVATILLNSTLAVVYGAGTARAKIIGDAREVGL